MTSSLPFDAAAIKRYGVGRWCTDFPVPVHWREFRLFVDRLFAGLDNTFIKLDRRDQEALLATSDFVITIRDVLYFEAFEASARSRGLTVDIEPPMRAALTDHTRLTNLLVSPLASPLALILRSVARTWAENGYLSPHHRGAATLGAALARPSHWSVGTMGGLKRIWLARHKEPVRTIYCDSIIARATRTARPAPSAALSDALDDFAGSMVTTVSATLGKDLPSANFSTAALFATWKTRAANVAGLIEAIERTAGTPPGRLYLNEVWKPHHRALSLALRRKGSEIVAFAHGNDPMHVLQPQHAYMAFGHISTYVCETPASAIAHAAHFTHSPVSMSFPVRFVSADTEDYVAKWRRAPPPAARSERPRVMVIGYPMLPHRTQFDVTNGLAMHLEGELRLLAMLRSRGFYTIYKAHPETRAQADGLFDGKADEVEYAPFESVVDNADIIVFLTTVSSTFGAAVCTRKPVVVLNPEGKAWNPIVADLYARRCRLIRTWIDDTNRIRVDEDAFWRALELPGAPPAFDLVETVFSPTAWKGPTAFASPPPTTDAATTDRA